MRSHSRSLLAIAFFVIFALGSSAAGNLSGEVGEISSVSMLTLGDLVSSPNLIVLLSSIAFCSSFFFFAVWTIFFKYFYSEPNQKKELPRILANVRAIGWLNWWYINTVARYFLKHSSVLFIAKNQSGISG
mgnify:FL=1